MPGSTTGACAGAGTSSGTGTAGGTGVGGTGSVAGGTSGSGVLCAMGALNMSGVKSVRIVLASWTNVNNVMQSCVWGAITIRAPRSSLVLLLLLGAAAGAFIAAGFFARFVVMAALIGLAGVVLGLVGFGFVGGLAGGVCWFLAHDVSNVM
jgi:hypothetical protein